MPQYEQGAVGLYSVSRPADDPLTNYQRTPLGDWPVPAEADRNDPWLRLVLLSRKRPVVIDLAVFIDGKSFRESREAWIDDVIAGAKSVKPPGGGVDLPSEVRTRTDPGIRIHSRRELTPRRRRLKMTRAECRPWVKVRLRPAALLSLRSPGRRLRCASG